VGAASQLPAAWFAGTLHGAVVAPPAALPTVNFHRRARCFVCLVSALAILAPAARAQVTQDFAVDLQATPSSTAPHLTLNWVQRQQAAVIAQRVHRRAKNATTWTLQATLATTDTTYPDPTATPGVEYEYWLERQYTGLSPSRPLAYLLAGAEVPAVESRGVLLLIVDDTMAGPLAPEIATLTDDLTGDGWTVQTHIVARTGTPPDVKALIQAAYTADPASVKAVYLLGHVPVPYSGVIAPDGHGDHIGAWPADGYYGDMDGTWTDTTANNSSASQARNRNIPGDGKFDQSSLPSNLELQVGRVDLAAMTQAPAATVSETTLLRRYLRKAHAYRHRLGAYANVPRRSMIRDGFGYFSGETFASSGWAAAFSTVGSQVDLPPSGGWFNQATANTYLFGYGNGGGSYTSASTVGNSADFGRRPSRVVFTILFGSYHGDWDSTNNFMRAPLAGNATGDSLGLTCYWSGRPYFYLHPAGLGENIGYAARLSMNNSFSNYQPAGSSARGVHTGLMGDPSLRLHMVEPPRHFAATTGGSQVTLRWDASTETDVLGYHVYRAPSPAGSFTRLTATPLATPGYTDGTGTVGSTYRYLVRTLKRETVPGGTYQNLSQGALATITVSASMTPAPFSPSGLTAQVLTSSQVALAWVDSAADETGFRIERSVNAGAFVQSGTVGANVTTFTDSAPLANGNVYSYRVVALGAGGDSLPSAAASVETSPGFFDLAGPRLKVSRGAGVAALLVNRFGASFSASTVTGTTSNVSAIAGVHYTSATGPVAFTDVENATRTVNVPLTTGATPQLPRQFNYTLSAPTNGAALAQQTVTRVLIEDPTATLPAPWTQTILGSVTDSSPAVFAEGAIGSAIAGGSATTTDNGRFIYQSRGGDGVLTAFIDAPLPTQNNARYGLMVRGSTASDVPMAAVHVASSTAGANLAIRTVTDGSISLLPGTGNSEFAPRWMRLTRSGDTFTAESSADGSTWTTLGAANVTIPSGALWGLYHHGDTSGNFQLARFRYVTLTAIGAVAPPGNFTLTGQPPAQVLLTWDPVGGATSYEIERRPRNGTFALHQTIPAGTVSFGDAVVPGVIYEYRLRAMNGATPSTWVLRAITAPGTTTPYQQWLNTNSLPMDGSGNGAPTVSVLHDGVWNAMKFALGLSAQIRGYFGRLSTGTALDGGQVYNSLTYTRPEPVPAGNVYAVKTGSDLGTWSAADTQEIANTVAGGLRTITLRDTIPASPTAPRRFIRLEVVVP
jgi:hypothetical protein